MVDILQEVLKHLPDSAKIAELGFEGANIVLYTKNREFFINNEGIIKQIVDTIKKRVELRCDPAITMDQEEAEAAIKKIIPEDAGADNITFDPQRSRVIIEAEKPGIAIGKSGEVLKEIKKATLWTPSIRRTPAIRSKIIENIRHVLYENNDYRKKFLDGVGRRIYGGWTTEKKQEWVRLSFLGGAREVGRSCILLQTPESKVLLDCGINVAGTDSDAYPVLDAPEFDIKKLDAVICSHAHLDHSGFISFLYKMGFRGPTYCTAPTRDISALLALDYISVAAKEAKKSIYSSTDVKEMVKHTICLDFGEVTDITPDLRITLYNSGHVLGSAQTHIHIGNGLHNFLYTGDMKFAKTRLLDEADTSFPRLETVLVEATYGSKDDVLQSRKEAEDDLLKAIKEAIARGGKVLVPVLGVGRAQEVMVIVHDAIKRGLLDKIPVYVQGMVWDVTAIHTAYPDFLNRDIKKAIFHRDQNPFLDPIFKQVAGMKEQREVIEEVGPCLILATSGMLQGGASVTYFKELADNPKNMLVLVSYQGKNTLGHRVQAGEKEIMISGNNGKPEVIKVNLEIRRIEGLTGHSTRNQLTSYIYNLDPKPKRVITNHGESSKCLDLASTIHKLNKIETNAPKVLEAIRIK